MKTYEAVFILDERQFSDGGDSFADEVVKQIEGLGGKLKDKNPMGRRPFARPIKKLNAGIYWDFVFDIDPTQVKPFQAKYSLNKSVLRLVTFNYEEPPKEK